MAVGSYTSRARIELLERLSRHAPAPDIRRTQIYSSGAEAIDSALRLAKSDTGKHKFVGFAGGFHGKTMGALSLMGSDFKDGYGPFVPGNHTVPYADCYRCPLKLSYPSCGLACADEARRQLKAGGAGAIAAFIVEPMQGTAGDIIPPLDWLPAIASLAREFDALLIVDEMITGFGRTGTYWGTDHSGVRRISRAGQAVWRRLSDQRDHGARKHCERQALGKSIRLIIELRRKFSCRGGCCRHASHHQ